MDRSLIEQYAAGADAPRKGIEGLTRAELNATPVPGTWSIQQIVTHLLDSDLIASHRMKRIIAEENPLIIGYNETRFAEKLYYPEMDAGLVCDLFALNRRLTADILRRLPVEAFERSGVHNERGRVTLADMVKMYVDHVPHHMKFLDKKRKMLGK